MFDDDFDIPDIIKYQLNVMFKFELPFDTGNLRHNAAGLILMKPGARYRIDEAEADYTRDVFEYYLYRRGKNFMYEAAFRMYLFLSWYFEGFDFKDTAFYTKAKQGVLFSSKNSEEREVRNILHGTGMFASDSTKEKVLGAFNEYTFTKQVLN
jgi:hypothetical protein